MQKVGFVLFDGFHVITFAAMAVFEVANKTLDEPRYDVRLLSEKGGSSDHPSERWSKRSLSAMEGSIH